MSRKQFATRVLSLALIASALPFPATAGSGPRAGRGLVDFDPEHIASPKTKSGSLKQKEFYVSVWYSTVTGRYGFARGPTVLVAHDRARKKCEDKECEMIAWVKNQCIAFAAGTSKSYAYAFANTAPQAEAIAKEKCRTVDYDCQIYVATCSDGIGKR